MEQQIIPRNRKVELEFQPPTTIKEQEKIEESETPIDKQIINIFKSKKGKWIIWGLIIGMILMTLIKIVRYFLR